MKVTITDIAKMAGVSKSTVSRFLNNGYVSEANRKKIQTAIDKTNYQVNFFAQALNADKSQLIGVIIPRFSSFTSNQTLKGIASSLEVAGYEMFITSSNLSVEKELKQIEKFIAMGVDGIISITTQITDDHVSLSQESKVPILFVGQTHPDVNCLAIDDHQVGKIAAEYLKSNQFKKALYIGVTEKDKAVGYYRKKGFIDHFDESTVVLESDFSFDNAYNLGSEVLKYDPEVIICTTDNMAIGMMRYFIEHHIDVPKDISVLSFGGYDVSSAIHPPLTTVAINYEGLGKQACSYLFNLIENPNYTQKSDLYEDFHLIERSSVKK